MGKPSRKFRERVNLHAERQPWHRVYRARMRAGIERCRRCGRHAPEVVLAFGHIVPHAHGGRYELDNVTILCVHCEKCQGGAVQIADLPSLAAEEALAHPSRRWGAIAEQVRFGGRTWNHFLVRVDLAQRLGVLV